MKKRKNNYGGVILFVRLQTSACNLSKSNPPPAVFFTFSKLYKWYQIAQSVAFILIDLNVDESSIQTFKYRQTLMREAVEWKAYVKKILENNGCRGDNIYEPDIYTSLNDNANFGMKAKIISQMTEKDVLQPAMQFWDFEHIYRYHGQEKPLLCPSCSSRLQFVDIKNRFAVRMLYDIDRPVLLVTSFLRCLNSNKMFHEILGYDPRLLRVFPQLDLPFMLFHKAGITKTLVQFIIESITVTGMTVNRLFDTIKTKYQVRHTLMSQFFENEIKSVVNFVNESGGEHKIIANISFPSYINCHPSKALLGRCFQAAFREKEEYYKNCMNQVLANECVILDSSVSVATRTGEPGIWKGTIKMLPEEYNGLFLIFNESKHILSWSFIRENNFMEVKDVLNEVYKRHLKENKSLKACFTTKCCEWREELRGIFGKWFIVKGALRLFIDSITSEMSSDHCYYKDCINELNLIFRKEDDREEVRKKYTADPASIAHNFEVSLGIVAKLSF